jgi:polyisoprenoid-binding protein YceI
MGASATTTVNRRDFGVGAIPAAVVSENVAITLDLELVKQGATKQ